MLLEALNNLPKEFETERIYARSMTDNDAPQLLEIWSDDNVTHHMNIETFHAVSEVSEMISAIELEATACRYVIIDKSTNEMIGSFGINELYLNSMTAEIGYELKESHWRKGIMTEILSSFIAVIQTTTTISALTAKVSPENIASSQLLMKLDFHFDKVVSEFNMQKKNVRNSRSVLA